MLSMLDQVSKYRTGMATEPAMLPVQIKDLTLEIGGRRLIDAMNCTLEEAGRTVVLGPNGAGKSLFLRLLHGLITPGSGEILWAGQKTSRAVTERQAMVFQSPVLLRRSVGENVSFALRHCREGKRERAGRVKAALAAARLDKLAGNPARQLSGGEQQRLALARALVTEPLLLFLDEPTASLDQASTLLVEQMIEKADQNGVKIVLVTHDIGQARRLADDVIFIHKGRIVEHSLAGKFFDNPASAIAQAYLEGQIIL